MTTLPALSTLHEARPTFDVGATGRLVRPVEDAHLATAWENELPVLSTPILLWWAELAAMDAVSGAISPPWMTVGAHHDAAHLAPTLAGVDVEVTARLVAADGGLLTFEVTAHDGTREVLTGRHTRGVVHAERFRDRNGIP